MVINERERRGIMWWIARAGLCLVLLTAIGSALTDAAAAARPSLDVTAVFDKASYVSGDEISVEFSVHNSGTADATDISAQDNSGPTELGLEDGFGKLSNGVTIPAGGTVTVKLSGRLKSLTATKLTLAGFLFDRHGNGVADFSFTAPVTVRTATVSGLVFGDANSNGHADPGEGVSGVKLKLSYVYATATYRVTTGAGGRFTVDVPLASYSVRGSGSGWTVIPQGVIVGAGGVDLALRAVRPLGDVLKPEMHFTKDTYAPGDTVHIVVTLTNTGSTTLRGIGAECDRAGEPDELSNAGPGWGQLAFNSPGLTLLAHQTSTFNVTDKVPAAAQRSGQVAVACDFGYPQVDEGNRPTAGDRARVPGQFGGIAGDVRYYPHSHGGPAVGLANVKVVLVDPTVCPLLSRTAMTNATGHFRIVHVPAGSSYRMYVYPPTGWKVTFEDPFNAFVLGNDTVRMFIEVEHGSATVPNVPTTCGSSTSPPPPPPVGIPIANTGADTAGLGGIGGAAIVVGLVLTLAGRRRRTH